MTDAGMVALVTGAAGGLGPPCCRALADLGMRVVVTDLDGDAADKVAADIGTDASAVALDVTSPGDVDALVASLDRVDVVVNLAGVVRNALLTKVTDDDFQLTMSTHVEGTLHTMRATAPGMRSRGYGRIVNMSSIAVRGSIAGSSYGAAKGAIEGMTRAAALELASHGVTVNCVAPGLVDAGMFRTVPEDYQAQSVARTPMRRAADADEVAVCVAFLASAKASYVTGQTLFVDGGLSVGF